ncbi:sensor histidine kinase [Nocardia sp. NBC_01327]|uniref:sensor histidine kinase n=1 Tax=Nocardia sp. NBC_01327 TaxID=2903593 RepID=UPI002E1253C6|nr:histidine kinase [Nocardia sp. NBC_01327]
MSPLPRSTGYLFLVCFTLSVFVGGASVATVVCCAGLAILLVAAEPRASNRWWILPAQVPLTYLPIALDGAATNLDCLIAATALRFLPARAKWPVFLGIVASSGFVHGNWRTDLAGSGYAALTTAAIGLVVYSLLRLPELVDRLTATNDELARVTLAQERLQVARTLRVALGEQLSSVMDLLRAARRQLTEQPAHARDTIRRAATATRTMIETVRSTAMLHSELDSAPGDPEPVARLAPRLAMLALVTSLFAWTARLTMESTDNRVAMACGGAALSGLLLAQLFRPRFATPMLMVQAAIVLIPLPWLGASWSAWLILLATAVLLTQPGIRAIAEVAALVALRALYTKPDARPGFQVGWVVPGLEATLVLFGLLQLWQLSDGLNRSRAALIRVTVQVERLRVARDIHDLLGLTLSVLVLKSDLVAELIPYHPQRAAAEIDESLRIAANAQRDTRLMGPRQSLFDELTTAAEVLTDNNIRVELTCRTGLPEPAATILIPVAREAVTNILRHSSATTVEIICLQRNNQLHLSIRNNGVAAGRTDGQGLRNMRSRVADAGGTFTTAIQQHEFLLTAAVPSADYAECIVATVDDAPGTGGVRTTC